MRVRRCLCKGYVGLQSLSTKTVDTDSVLHLVRDKARQDFSDLSSPSEWYPLARKIKRTVIAHVGPTNSGKTHEALTALKKARTGIYCAPLRLLAWEGYDKMTGSAVKVSLLTGQEMENCPGSTHMACTVEMADVNRMYEAAVIDEYQLMGDPTRGWAFTRAILGLAVKTLYVCGHPSALGLLHALCQETGDRLEVVEFERLSPLSVEETGVSSLDSIEKGDCLIAFSRRDIHLTKRLVEARGHHSCCLVYGALPPESRREQARLFNDKGNSYSVLVASDAIGMGLNLDIRRVVFTSIEKYDGTRKRFLSVSEVKQISGRAGRYGSLFPDGMVSSLSSQDIPFLKFAMGRNDPLIKVAGLLPRYEQFALFAQQAEKSKVDDVIKAFRECCAVSGHYFLTDLTPMQEIASLIRHLPLTLREQFLFGMSPVDSRNLEPASEFLAYCTAYVSQESVSVDCGALVPRLHRLHSPETEADLRTLENVHGVLDLYLWLANRMPERFPERAKAKKLRQMCTIAVEAGLKAITKRS